MSRVEKKQKIRVEVRIYRKMPNAASKKYGADGFCVLYYREVLFFIIDEVEDLVMDGQEVKCA